MNLQSLTDRLPKYLSDDQVAELQRSSLYTRYQGKCPVCLDDGEYRFMGKTYECPDDDFGHTMERLFKVYCLANIPMEYQVLDWANFPKTEGHTKAKEHAEQYLAKYERARLAGMGWEIMGKHLGVGKTWLATHLLKQVVLQGYSGWFVSFMALKSLYELDDAVERDRIQSKLMSVDFLVIDDILKPRSDKQRGFFEDQLEVVIRHRTSSNLPTGTTTNMVEADLQSEFPRIYSLLTAKQFRVELGGVDFRTGGAYVSNAELAMNGEVRPLTW